MQPILLVLIIFTVVSLLGVGLFYVGTKLFYNVSTDVANAITPTTTTTSSSPNGPNGPDKPNIPTENTVSTVTGSTVTVPITTTPAVTTTPLPPGTLETWSDTTFQGEKLDSVDLAGLLLPYNSLRKSIDTRSQSIRFSSGYTVYLAYYDSTSQPVTADDVRSAANNIPLSNETPTIPIAPFKTPFIGVYSNATTTTTTTKTTRPLRHLLELYGDPYFKTLKSTVDLKQLANNYIPITLIQSVTFPFYGYTIIMLPLYLLQAALPSQNNNMDQVYAYYSIQANCVNAVNSNDGSYIYHQTEQMPYNGDGALFIFENTINELAPVTPIIPIPHGLAICKDKYFREPIGITNLEGITLPYIIQLNNSINSPTASCYFSPGYRIVYFTASQVQAANNDCTNVERRCDFPSYLLEQSTAGYPMFQGYIYNSQASNISNSCPILPGNGTNGLMIVVSYTEPPASN